MVGFEPTASRSQGEDSDQAELHPENEQLEITAARTAPFVALSVTCQACPVRAYPLETAAAASESCGMTAFLIRRRYLFAAQLLDASSTVCLAGSEGFRATVRVGIEDLWLGAADLPEFRSKAIRAYATFAVPRDASFRFGVFRPESNRHPLLLRQLLYH